MARKRKKGMDFRFDVLGVEQYAQTLEAIGENTDNIARGVIRKGAGLAANAVRKEIEAIPEHRAGTAGGVRGYERKALLKGLGISPINAFNDDFLNAKIGFAGYSDRLLSGRRVHRWGFDGGRHYDTYEPGVGYIAVPIIARSISGGTSFSPKYPFVRIAMESNQDIIYGAMRGVFFSEVNKIMNRR